MKKLSPDSRSASEDPIARVTRRAADQRMAQREEILQAFAAKYGFSPEQAIQIEQWREDGTRTWRIESVEPKAKGPALDQPKIYRTVEKIDFESLPQKVMDGEICHEPVLVDHWHGIGSMFLECHTECDILRWLANEMGGFGDLIEMAELMRDGKLGGYEPVPASPIAPPDLIKALELAESSMCVLKDAMASATAALPLVRKVLSRLAGSCSRDHAREPEEPTDQEIAECLVAAGVDALEGESDGTSRMYWQGWHDQVLAGIRAVIAADRARYARPAIEPVPVAERLPGPEDCDSEGLLHLAENGLNALRNQLTSSQDDYDAIFVALNRLASLSRPAANPIQSRQQEANQ
jgi:hypothetical protein